MEISKSQIARLVLGYLKSENCINAFNEFLIKSQYLKSHAVFVKNGKYFATRVGGNTLEDIISEYSELALIIQGKLEQTSYYEKDLRLKLPEQLMFILDPKSRSSSPILSESLNATTIESLPGNSSNICHNSRGKSTVENEKCTPMEYHTSKISPGSLQKDEKKTSLAELDNQISSIKQKAEKDPVFDKLLEEIIGHKINTPIKHSTTNSYLDKSQPSEIVIEISDNEKSTPNLNVENSNYFPNKKATNTSQSGVKNCENIAGDTYSSKPPTISPQQNQIFLTNSSGLLMVPSLMNAPNYIFLNNGPARPTPFSSVLTETELMKMPTVILEESSSTQQQFLTVPQSQMAVQQSQIQINPMMINQSQIIMTSEPHTLMTSQKPITTTITSSDTIRTQTTTKNESIRKIKTIAPKTDKITIATTDGDFYKVFDEDSNQMEVFAELSETEKPCHRQGLRKRSLKPSKSSVISPSKKEKTPSPPKRSLNVIESPAREEKKKKSVKSLFEDNKKAQKRSAWDADLRELLIPHEDSKKIGEQQDKSDVGIVPSDDVSDDKLDISCDDGDLEKEALAIEAAFKTPVKIQHEVKEQEVEENKEITNEKTESEIAQLSEEKSETSGSTGGKSSLKSEDLENEEKTVITEETEVYLRNCNGPPRIKKKCNQTNGAEIFEVEVIDESRLTEQKPIDEVSIEEESKSRTKRDITQETPVKVTLPKTPGKFEMTPFSIALEEQLRGIDLLSLPTPTLAISPDLPITPNINLNSSDHHSNRPTDYSTSSSYYQPSDTEQNKSLETMMEEYRREEKKKEKQSELQEKAETNSNKEMGVTEVPVSSEMKKIFNKSIIGKKNLSLMKERDYSGSEDAENSSSSGSSTNGESSSNGDSDSDIDPAPKKSTTSPKDSYCFRKRNIPIPKLSNEERNNQIKSSPTKTPNKNIKYMEQEIIEKPEGTSKSSKKGNINTSSTTRRRNPPRTKNGKYGTIKNETKMTPKTNEQLMEKFDNENEITDDDFALHLSTDEDSINKINNDEATNENKDVLPPRVEQPSTEGAKQLVQDLYDRGIHLLPKVTPKKTSDSSAEVGKKTDSESEINLNALENLDISSEDNSSSECKNEAASDLSSNQNRADVVFVTDCNDYTLNIISDSSKRRKKKVIDLNLSGRKISANLFIASLDIEMEKILEISPIETIFEISPKKLPVKKRRNVNPEIKPENSKTSTPNEKQVGGSRTAIKTEQKSIDEKEVQKNEASANKNRKSGTSNNKNRKSENLGTESQRKSYSKKLRSCSTGDRSSENANSSIISNTKIVEITPAEMGSAEVTVIERLQNDIEELPAIGSGEDDLMNFAVVGNLVDQEKEVSLKNRDKRKCSSEGENRPPGKKPKGENEEKQALLKKINVDLFLNEVHGAAKSSL